MPLPNEEFMVFLSHSEAPTDTGLTRFITETLDRLHVRTFVYEYYLVGGTNRFEQIKLRINSTPYFLILLTSNGLQSQWVNQEIGYAVGRGKTLIPILETDPFSGDRLKSRGFVELHDPILLKPSEPQVMIRQLIYTFYALLKPDRRWQDLIWITCACGHEFDGRLDFGQLLQRNDWVTHWQCPECEYPLQIDLCSFGFQFL